MDQVQALGKWIASFKKANWVLDDYPLRFTESEVTIVAWRVRGRAQLGVSLPLPLLYRP